MEEGAMRTLQLSLMHGDFTTSNEMFAILRDLNRQRFEVKVFQGCNEIGMGMKNYY